MGQFWSESASRDIHSSATTNPYLEAVEWLNKYENGKTSFQSIQDIPYVLAADLKEFVQQPDFVGLGAI